MVFILLPIRLKYRLTTTDESVSTIKDKSPLEMQHTVIVDDMFFILSQSVRKDFKLGILIENCNDNENENE